MVLVGVVGHDYRGEIGVLLHSGDKEEGVRNTGDPLEHLFKAFPRSVIKDNGILQQPNCWVGTITKGPDSAK